jgi:mycofactocin system transcriptional regulator
MPSTEPSLSHAARPVRPGRTPLTSRAALSRVAFELFDKNGFDETTVDDIAREAGIGRRTFFRYFSTKNDLPWGDFDDLVAQLRAALAAMPRDLPIAQSLRRAILDFNRLPPDEVAYHRRRMELLLNVPSLVAHSTIRYASWRAAIADFVAARLRVDSADFRARAVGWVCLSLCLAAYEEWLRDPGADLTAVLERSLSIVDPVVVGIEEELA